MDFFDDVESARTKLLNECQKSINRAKESQVAEQKATSKIAEIDLEISEKNEQLELVSDQLQAEIQNKENLTTSISALQITQRQLTDTITTLESNIETRKSTQFKMSQQIAESEKKLRTLENDINLFPTEIAGYVAQGSKNIRTYLLIGAVPILIIAVLTLRLVFNSEELVEFYARSPEINIFEFLASRLPTVIISVSILGICYTFIHRLISEIIGINRRRQDLYKISIIATDISNASASGSIVDGETQYRYRTYTKMEMLKEHLRRHMGEGFTFEKKGGLLAMLSDISTTAITGKTDKDDDE